MLLKFPCQLFQVILSKQSAAIRMSHINMLPRPTACHGLVLSHFILRKERVKIVIFFSPLIESYSVFILLVFRDCPWTSDSSIDISQLQIIATDYRVPTLESYCNTNPLVNSYSFSKTILQMSALWKHLCVVSGGKAVFAYLQTGSTRLG